MEKAEREILEIQNKLSNISPISEEEEEEKEDDTNEDKKTAKEKKLIEAPKSSSTDEPNTEANDK